MLELVVVALVLIFVVPTATLLLASILASFAEPGEKIEYLGPGKRRDR